MALVQRSRGRVAFDGVPTVPGLVYISGTTLTATTSFLDIVLPSQYAWFHLTLINFGASDPTNDNLCFAWSSNGGTTFFGGGGPPRTAYSITDTQSSIIETVTSSVTEGFTDSLGYVGGWPVGFGSATGKYFVEADIFPGDASNVAVWNGFVTIELPVSSSTEGNAAFVQSQVALNRSSTGPTPARVNLIRLLPYADGDTTPPTGHGLASGGSYALWGFRA
jgi:hypothetical protein